MVQRLHLRQLAHPDCLLQIPNQAGQGDLSILLQSHRPLPSLLDMATQQCAQKVSIMGVPLLLPEVDIWSIEVAKMTYRYVDNRT